MLIGMTSIVGEALNRRSDLQKRIAQLQERLSACVLAQEGEEPPESPDELLAELDGRCDELQALIAKINHTNASITASKLSSASGRRCASAAIAASPLLAGASQHPW
jgi:hypothetical protein